MQDMLVKYVSTAIGNHIDLDLDVQLELVSSVYSNLRDFLRSIGEEPHTLIQ